MSIDSAKNSRFTNEELTAFLDGESEYTPVVEINRALQTDTNLADQVESLALDKEMIEQAFQTLKPSSFSIPTPPTNSVIQDNRDFSFAQMAASFIVAVGIGFGVAQITVLSKDNRNWKDFVAAYQVLYTTETLASIGNRSDSDLSDELKRISAMLGKQIDLNTLKSAGILDYKRAQSLGYNNLPVIQLAFLDEKNQPFALCIYKTTKFNSANLEFSNMEGLEAATWSKDGYEYLLIGGKDKTIIATAAEHFYKQI